MDLRGEAGADTFVFRTAASASGGSGNDLFVFEAVVPVTITDLARGDRIDLSALVDGPASAAFQDGHLKSTISKGYTHLSIDTDGGGGDLAGLLTLKGQYRQLEDFIV